MSLPLPETMGSLYRDWDRTSFHGSASMVLSRGIDTWSRWAPKAELDKGDFLSRFADAFREPRDFPPWLERRRQVLKDLGAVTVTHRTDSRLVVGLGLPHPTETGFLLDRTTSSPYLPGSSVKGLLRAAAREAASQDWSPLAPDRGFWADHLEEVFGASASTDDTEASRGTCIFYDAFPERWPKLEVDVLTPHYSRYYAHGETPGDWEPPVPVSFLTVESGTPFSFPIRPRPRQQGGLDRQDLLAHLHRLLAVALAWLGAGGKTQAGYGFFEEKAPETFRGPVEETWPDAHLLWIKNRGVVEATAADRRKAEAPAQAFFSSAPEALARRLGKKPAQATVRVRPRDVGGLELVGLTEAE